MRLCRASSASSSGMARAANSVGSSNRMTGTVRCAIRLRGLGALRQAAQDDRVPSFGPGRLDPLLYQGPTDLRVGYLFGLELGDLGRHVGADGSRAHLLRTCLPSAQLPRAAL